MEWAALINKASDSLKQQYVQLKEEAQSTASNMAKKIESAKADLDGLGEKRAGNTEASSSADIECAASSSAGASTAAPLANANETGGAVGYFEASISNVQDPKASTASAFQRLQEESGGESHKQAVDIGCTEVTAPADEAGAPVEAISTDSPSWTRFLPSFVGGPIERIGKYMRGEMDFIGLGICNCCIGPTVADKDQTHQESKSAYGLGVCVCCIGGEKSKQEESDMRKNIKEKLLRTHYRSNPSSGLVTSSAADVLSRYRREGRTTQAGARARAEARVQRILALQERAVERTARLKGKWSKPTKHAESFIGSQANDLLAKAQERRKQDMENDKAAGEMPLLLQVDV
jgi:hypothetical protein